MPESPEERLLALGAYPDVPLKRAREKRDEARKLVADPPSAGWVAEHDGQHLGRLRLEQRFELAALGSRYPCTAAWMATLVTLGCWVSFVIEAPRERVMWTGLMVSSAIAGACWLLAETYRSDAWLALPWRAAGILPRPRSGNLFRRRDSSAGRATHS